MIKKIESCQYTFQGRLIVSTNPHPKVFNLFVCENCKGVYVVSSEVNVSWLANQLKLSFRKGGVSWNKFVSRLEKRLKDYGCKLLLKKGVKI